MQQEICHKKKGTSACQAQIQGGLPVKKKYKADSLAQ
jgi:hypothetical protein